MGEFHTGYEEHAVDAKINGDAYPANKEQRNIFFEKMKEAGYRWNPDEKKPEKIESADESSAFKDKLLELFQRFRWYCEDQTPTNGDIIEYVDAHIQELIDTVQNNPWSEEDEYNLLSAIKKLEKLAEYEKRVAERDNWERTYVLIDWIKSLKDRIK